MRIDGQTQGANQLLSGVTDIVGKLSAGDIVRAQVLEISSSEVMLKLYDGSTVTAATFSPLELKQGDIANFIVEDIVDGKLVLESIKSNNATQSVNDPFKDIKDTLTQLNLPLTEQNIEIGDSLKNRNMPVNADTIAKVKELISNNQDLKANAASFLTAAKMADNQNNIDKLQNLLAGRLKIGNDINDLVKLVSSLTLETTADSSAGRNIELISNKLLDSTNNNLSQNDKQVINNVLSKLNNTFREAANILQGIYNKNENPEINNDKAVIKNAGLQSTDKQISVNNPSDINNGSISAASNANTDELLNNFKNTTGNIQFNSELQDSNLTSIQNKAALSQPAQISMELGKLLNELENILTKGNLTPEQEANIKLLNNEINNTMQKLNKKDFEDAVNDLKKLFVKIDSGEKDPSIDPMKLYKDLDEAVSHVKHSAAQISGALRDTALNIANNLESNMNFINQLNNYSSYMQIPLSVFNQSTTGELFMLKKGSKAKKLDPSDITVLISLDSKNAGRIDTLMSIEKKNISINFRLENSDVFPVLKDNHKKLYNLLLEKGYRLVDFTYRLIDEPINIVNFETEAKKEFIKKPLNFDITI